MLKKIAGTTFTRIVNAIIALLIVIIAAKNLGTEQYGSISLLLVSIALIILINNFIGGSALVYLSTRVNNLNLIIPSYIWAFLASLIGTLLISVFKFIPDDLKIHLFILSILQSVNTIHSSILLGHKKIKEVNILSFIQALSFLILFYILIFIYDEKNIFSYVKSLYISYTLPVIIGFIFVYRFLDSKDTRLISKSTILQILKLGKYFQLANIAQFFNYRLNYFIIESFLGRSALGIYSAGNQLAEGMWLVSKSISMVQYSHISNSNNTDYQKNLTIRLIKLSFVVTLLMLIVLLCIPENIFILLLGKDFVDIKLIIAGLSIGIISVALSTLFSSYFSGIGKPKYSSIASLIGLAATIILGFTLIPRYGIVAAGIIASIAYLLSVIYQIVVFIKISKTTFIEFIPNKTDFNYLKSEFETFRKK